MSVSDRLSKRLEAVAGFVTKGNGIIDIGTDHAYLPIELISRGIASSALAVDVNPGPLERAKENIRKAGLEDKIKISLGNGLSGVDDTAGKSIIIAGMGGPLALGILEAYPEKIAASSEFILQIQSRIEDFRRGLEKINIKIIDEDMVFENGKYYPVIKAVSAGDFPKEEPSDKKDANALKNLIHYRYGPVLMEKKSGVLMEFLIFERGILDKAIEEIKRNKSDSKETKEKLKELEEKRYLNREAERLMSV